MFTGLKEEKLLKMKKPMSCDLETGQCEPGMLPDTNEQHASTHHEEKIIYVGDPMCSWCWGMAPELKKLRESFGEQRLDFQVIVGGLRPGGGERWDENFRSMLRHHWEEVHRRTGQPFGYALFDREEFNYDTEPPCRAVVVARMLDEEKELDFMEAIQCKFYVESADPGQVEFYESICQNFDLDFVLFQQLFINDEVVKQTWNEFRLNREWGVRGYPTILYQNDDRLYLISPGYTPFDQLKDHIEKIQVVLSDEADA